MNTKILVLEDDLPSLKLVTAILRKYNYTVIEATDGLEAIHLAEKEVPQLAIIDVMLPTLNGYQVCERLRKIPALKNMPIIILTVLNEDQHRIRSIEAGATDFLSKPFNRVELLTKIKALLSINEELANCEDFNHVIYCLMTALHHRNPNIAENSIRIGSLAERLALCLNLPLDDIVNMKNGAYLQDIGQIAMTSDIHLLEEQASKDAHSVLGYKMFAHFNRPIIKNIILHHHNHLKSESYPTDLPDYIKPLLNIVALTNRFVQLRYGENSLSIPVALSIMEDETHQGLWDKEIFDILSNQLNLES